MIAASSLLLLLDVGTQLEDVLLAGGLKLVGEAEVFDLNLWKTHRSLLHPAADAQVKMRLNWWAHQLEVRDSHSTLLVHLLLVFVLNQTCHQVARVDLVVSDLLTAQRAERNRFRTGRSASES